jgi:hypothetical protein
MPVQLDISATANNDALITNQVTLFNHAEQAAGPSCTPSTAKENSALTIRKV